MKEKKETQKMKEFWKRYAQKTCQIEKTVAVVSINVPSENQLSSACSSSDRIVAGLETPIDQDVESSPDSSGSKLKSETSSSSKT